MSKLERWLDLLIYGMMVGISVVWMLWPEDIVGTRELAVLLVVILWRDLRRDE